MAKDKPNRSKVIDDIRNILGDGMVDVELDRLFRRSTKPGFRIQNF